jgi:predicted lipopolysaccharide heptosyltransferase III
MEACFMLIVVQRILLIQLKRLGDFILTVPVASALRTAFPSAELVMVVPAPVAELARCIPQLDRVISFHPGRPNLETWASALAGEWDACLDFTGSDRSALLTKLSRAKLRIGYEKHARRLRKLAYTSLSHASVRELHTVDFHLALLAELGVSSPVVGRGLLLKLPHEVKRQTRLVLEEAGVSGPYAVVHPGTAREEKFWMNDRWAEVCASLHRHENLSIVLTGSADGIEVPHLEALRRRLRVPVADLTGRLTLVEFAAVIAGCELIVGVDSMAMHLAALFSRPQVALFGPTNPFHWRPRHPEARVLLAGANGPVTSFTPKERKRDMKLISTQAVVDATRSLLSPE